MKLGRAIELLNSAQQNPKLDSPLSKRMAAAHAVLARVANRENKGALSNSRDVSQSVRPGGKSLDLSRPPVAGKTKSGALYKPLEIVWKHGCVSKCFVHGTFTEPAWIEGIPLSKDSSGLFKVDLSERGLAPGTYIFKFVVDGEWKIDKSQPTHRDLNGNVNNSMFVRSSLRPLKSVMSAPAIETANSSNDGSGCSTPAMDTPLHRRGVTSSLQQRFSQPVSPSEQGSTALSLICGGWMIPHPEKMASGGADSFFYSSSSAGVADGVGEWEWRFKLDPRKFAEQLMKGCQYEAKKYENEKTIRPDVELKALHLLASGYAKASAFGSSTACVVSLEGDKLGIANIGDSGCIQFRKHAHGMTSVMRTREQQHAFNMPYQLSRLPDPAQYDEIAKDPIYSELIAALRTLSGRQLSKIDSPADSELYSSVVCEGDLILLASDGVLDNLWSYDLVSLVSESVTPLESRLYGIAPSDPEELAKSIALAAFEKSCIESGYKSPFGVECRKRTGAVHMGGKMDDITVVVCWVARTEDVPSMMLKINTDQRACGPLSNESTCRDWWKQQVGKARRTSTDEGRQKSNFEMFNSNLGQNDATQ